MAIILLGIVMCIVSAYLPMPWNNVVLSIGCSLMASGIVTLAHDFLVEKKQVSLLDEWKIEKIYSTRSEKNAESDPELMKTKYCILILKKDILNWSKNRFRNFRAIATRLYA